ncbi:MAG: Ig-like domain-containing protein, partial [Solirubrobacterales bacterium]
MNRSRSTILALAVVVAALCTFATSALAAEPTVSVTISAPANNAYSAATPNLVFSTTGTGLLKTCSVVGPGVEVIDELCSSNWNPGTLPDGSYTYTVTVEKVSDGGSASASRNFKIDKTAPAITIGGTPAAGVSNSASIALTATVSDANPAYLNCRVDDDLWGECGGTITNGTFNLADALVGGHSYQFTATDKAGNMSVAARSITIDRAAPVVSISSTGWGTETKDNTPAFLVSATDASSVT